MKDSNLSRWLYHNKCFLTKDSKLEKTHLCLDGGRLSIPNHLILDFYREYAKGILSGEKYYICETTSPVIKMYCDFDYIGDEQVSDSQLENWSKLCRNVIRDKFGSHYDFTVCCSSSKTVQKNKRKQIKSGIHFVWRELFVTTDIAHRVAMALIEEFNETFPNSEWKEYIDLGVYTNGLRMVGSRKVINKKRKVRDTSAQSEESAAPATQKNDYEIIKVDEGREYIPYMYVTSDTITKPEEDQLCYYNLAQLRKILTDTTIRTFNNENPIIPVGELPDTPESKKKKSGTKRDTDIEDPKVFDRVESFIRYQTITQWNSPMVQLRKHGKFYIAKIDSMYCLNVQRDHNSCGIYFQITEQGLYQRCFCRCDTTDGRLDGPCSQYKSSPFPLPREVVKMLFPNASNKKIGTKANQNKINPGKEVFASNILMKSRETLPLYLKMSLNTVYLIEKKCL